MRASVASVLVTSWVLVVAACASLKTAPEPGAAPPGEDASSAGDGDPTDSGSAGPPDAKPAYASYDAAQDALSWMPWPGPTTAQGSMGQCTSKLFVWRDSDGKVHSWEPKTSLLTNYLFVGARISFVPSDLYIAVDVPPSFAQVDVFQTNLPHSLFGSMPPATHYVASNDGVIRLDQKIDGVDLGGTKVRRWIAQSGQIEDISQVLPTTQWAAAFANGQLAIPGGAAVPFAIHLVDVNAKTTTSVTFDDATVLRQVLPSPSGLLVSYERSGGATALRLYRGDKDDAPSRFELGDYLASVPGLFPDSPPGEHAFRKRVATYGSNVVIYDSEYGLFAFNLVTSALTPLQLGKKNEAFLVDTLCVVPDADAVVYRRVGDPARRIWAVTLSSLLP